VVGSYRAVPASIAHVRQELVAFARRVGASEETIEAIRLASSEAAANVVEHAYADQEPGDVEITADVSAGSIWVVIADQGRGLEVGRSSPGLGLGFVWMTKFSDSMTLVTPPEGGLEVMLGFSLAPGFAETSHPG
jgi:anti-sigma regulatory factor (Ser/Thr protein kinase)